MGWSSDYFEVMFNPESYRLSYKNVYTKYQGINTSGREQNYTRSDPEELSLTLVLDNTGTTGLGITNLITKGKDVYKKVQGFLEFTHQMVGDKHKPNDLVVEWGDLVFECVLISLDIKYTVFNRSGQPLRAELDATFKGSIQDSKRVRKEDKSSPDLTHERDVKSEDTLPLLANEIYNDASYYIQVARANRLNNLRKLKTGSRIVFPPVKK